MRLIDADALMADIERTIENSGCVNHEGDIMDCVRYAPTISAVPVVRGEWIEHEDEMECPQCGYFWNYCDNDTERFNYCPNCGAKMESEVKE